MSRLWLSLASLGLALAAGALAAPADAPEPGFTRLFNGKDMQGLKLIGTPAATWKVVDGVIVCSGAPNGYMATEKSYRNYVLKFDWRYARPAALEKDADFGGNSGLLVHIAGEHKVWPMCVEVQLQNKDAGNIFGLFGAKATARKDAAAQARAIKPVGQWNSMEVESRDGKLVARVNGELIAEATDAQPKEGPLGWQSEGSEIHFRNLRIKTLE